MESLWLMGWKTAHMKQAAGAKGNRPNVTVSCKIVTPAQSEVISR